jgi:alpha-tubulin suppressor-like RCC1 family protein
MNKPQIFLFLGMNFIVIIAILFVSAGSVIASPVPSNYPSSGTRNVSLIRSANEVSNLGTGNESNAAFTTQTSCDVWEWGVIDNGELGTVPGINESNVPIQISGLTGVIAMAAGDEDNLILKSDGTVWAWGYNPFGNLGNGTNSDTSLVDGSFIPVQVSGLTNIVAVSEGSYHSLALKSDGTVWAWGDNSYGQLGDGTSTNSNIPVQVRGLTEVIAIDADEFDSMALKSDGTVWDWGSNSGDSLGNGSPYYASFVPVQVSGLTSVVGISSGDIDKMALKSDGTVWDWGDNTDGQLGNGNNNSSDFPVQVNNLSGVIAVSAGWAYCLALKSDGTVYAWGGNNWGELGDGTNTNSSLPVQVSNLSGVNAVSAGWAYCLALKSDGTVYAWGGNNWGELGDGTNIDSNFPRRD